MRAVLIVRTARCLFHIKVFVLYKGVECFYKPPWPLFSVQLTYHIVVVVLELIHTMRYTMFSAFKSAMMQASASMRLFSSVFIVLYVFIDALGIGRSNGAIYYRGWRLTGAFCCFSFGRA